MRFVDPARFSDVESVAGDRSREAVSAEIEGHLRRLVRTLGPRETLSVDVLDIDLAGETTIGGGSSSGTRIVSNRTPPRIRLRWSFASGGRTVAGGTETLSDPFYAWNPAARVSGDPLGFEKELLTGWYRRRVRPLTASGAGG